MSSGTSPQAIRASTNYRECPCPKGPPVTPRNLSGAVQRLSSQPQCFSRRLLCLNRESIEKVTASKHKAGCLKEANHVKLATKACILCHSTSRCKTPTDFDGNRVDGETVFWWTCLKSTGKGPTPGPFWIEMQEETAMMFFTFTKDCGILRCTVIGMDTWKTQAIQSASTIQAFHPGNARLVQKIFKFADYTPKKTLVCLGFLWDASCTQKLMPVMAASEIQRIATAKEASVQSGYSQYHLVGTVPNASYWKKQLVPNHGTQNLLDFQFNKSTLAFDFISQQKSKCKKINPHKRTQPNNV